MKAFIISLKNIKSSIKSAYEVLESLKQYNFDAELFEGTYGSKAERMFDENNIKLVSGFTDRDNWKFSSPGVKGCFHSHYRLWRKCAKLNEPIAIFEDDVVFERNYIPVEFSEVLVLSINYDWAAVRDQYKHLLEEQSEVPEALDYNFKYMPGCSGYIITPSAARKLAKTYKTTYLPADCAINNLICDIKIHSMLMGRSKTMSEKESLTRTRKWNESIRNKSK
jgi:GR25 family glycosyltransferase involved in LPS biosynthesis